MAASVWMKFSNERVCSLRPSERPFAEMTPTVSVFSNWNGLPTAMAQSPLRMRSESPSGTLGSDWPAIDLEQSDVGGRIAADDLRLDGVAAVAVLVGAAVHLDLRWRLR